MCPYIFKSARLIYALAQNKFMGKAMAPISWNKDYKLTIIN